MNFNPGGLSAGSGAHCPSFVCETLCFRSILELNCFLSFVYIIRSPVLTEGNKLVK